VCSLVNAGADWVPVRNSGCHRQCGTKRNNERMQVRRGTLAEIHGLSALALESKRYWGYDDNFIERCRAELTVTEEDVNTGLLFVAEDDLNRVAGFFLLSEYPFPELSMLLVSPDDIGCDVGKALFRDALRVASVVSRN